jgi:acetyl/propionyl-CoA carboxylase alpha subunit
MAFKLWLDGRVHEVEIVARRPHLVISIDGREHEVSTTGTPDGGRQTIEIGGLPVHFARAHIGDRQIVRLGGATFEGRLLDPRSQADQSGAGRDHVRAPMPGAVVAVHKPAGATVKRGEAIVTIESMKLQMALNAPRDGVIAELTRQEGETFEKDEVIVRLETLAEES